VIFEPNSSFLCIDKETEAKKTTSASLKFSFFCAD